MLQGLSLMIGVGWAWAALAVAAGWWVRVLARSAVAGALSLLGAVGTLARQHGVLALLAALVVPMGAAVQLLVFDAASPDGAPPLPGTAGARMATWVLIIALGSAAILCFARQRTSSISRTTTAPA